MPKRKKRGPVELGRGGVKFERDGDRTFALPCEATLGNSNSTISGVAATYTLLSAELPKFYSFVKEKKGKITGAELKIQFRRSPIAKAADQSDWDGWAVGFSPENSKRGRPKGAALTFLEKKMSIERQTIKSYLSRAKKLVKPKK